MAVRRKSIALLGFGNSGKTAFIAMLDDYLRNFPGPYELKYEDKNTIKHITKTQDLIFAGEDLQPTPPGDAHIINITLKKHRRHYSLVTYDIGGEFIRDKLSIGDPLSGYFDRFKQRNIHLSSLLASDGLLILIEPENDSEQRRKDSNRWSNFILMLRSEKLSRLNQKLKTPVAIAFSKYDKYKPNPLLMHPSSNVKDELEEPRKYLKKYYRPLHTALENSVMKFGCYTCTAYGHLYEKSNRDASKIQPDGIIEPIDFLILNF